MAIDPIRKGHRHLNKLDLNKINFYCKDLFPKILPTVLAEVLKQILKRNQMYKTDNFAKNIGNVRYKG